MICKDNKGTIGDGSLGPWFLDQENRPQWSPSGLNSKYL